MGTASGGERRRAIAPGERARVAVIGATGMIGGAIVAALSRAGHDVVRVVRRPRDAAAGDIVWDPERGAPSESALEGLDAIAHVVGRPVDTRWTERVREEIRRSRVDSTRALARTIARLTRKPRVLVTASAVGYYGDRGDELLDEGSASGGGFLAGIVRDWEGASQPARDAGVRVVPLRFGLVLAREGGALARMLPAFRLGAGGALGSGRQWMSWVSLDDAAAAALHALAREELDGPVNVVAPEPVRNAEFADVLGRVLGRPTVVAVPAFALRLAFGEMADETILASQRVRPAALERAGFSFRHAELTGTLRAMLETR
jgi:uncharacterized protein (TIGR01777 family)